MRARIAQTSKNFFFFLLKYRLVSIDLDANLKAINRMTSKKNACDVIGNRSTGKCSANGPSLRPIRIIKPRAQSHFLLHNECIKSNLISFNFNSFQINCVRKSAAKGGCPPGLKRPGTEAEFADF